MQLVLAIRPIALASLLLAGLASTLLAQSPNSSFDVASIRLNRTDLPATTLFPLGAGETVRLVGNGEPMGRIAEALRGPSTGIDRHIRDRTGLTGTFDLSLEWSVMSDAVPIGALDNSGPRLREALEQQLGLTLRSGRGPVDVLIVDRIERPTAN